MHKNDKEMISKKDKDISTEELSKNMEDIKELKQFLQKKKNQNVALKKLIDNLNTDENYTKNK